MKTTRILIAEYNSAVKPVCKTAGFIRADIWRRCGGLKTVGKTNSAIRSEINELGVYKSMTIDGTIRAETTKDILYWRGSSLPLPESEKIHP